MPQVQLDDRVFQTAQRRAMESGYASVDAYVADVIANDLPVDPAEITPNLDCLFTPERIAELQQVCAEIDAGGKTYTMDEVREHFERRRQIANAKEAG